MVNLVRLGVTRLYIEQPARQMGAGPGIAFFSSADLGNLVALDKLTEARGVFGIFCTFTDPAEQAWTKLAKGLQAVLDNLSGDEFGLCWSDPRDIGGVSTIIRGDLRSRALKTPIVHTCAGPDRMIEEIQVSAGAKLLVRSDSLAVIKPSPVPTGWSALYRLGDVAHPIEVENDVVLSILVGLHQNERAGGSLELLLAPEAGLRVIKDVDPAFRFSLAASTTAPPGQFIRVTTVHGGLFDARNAEGPKLVVRTHPFARTQAAFSHLQLGAFDAGLLSNLSTTHGWQVQLAPRDGVRVVFADQPQALQPGTQRPVGVVLNYATLHGSFEAVVPPGADPTSKGIHGLLMGVPGTEFVNMKMRRGSDDAPGDLIVLEAGQPAFITDSLHPGTRGLSELTRTAHLAVRSTTAQAFAVQANRYVVQPQQAPLFVPVPGAPGKFDFDQLPLPLGQDKFVPILPMRARAATAKQFDAARLLDMGTLAPSRRKIVTEASLAPHTLIAEEAVESAWRTTPQGFLVEINDNDQWKRIKFAVSANDTTLSIILERPNENGQPAPRWDLQDALQQQHVFLVATSLPAAPSGVANPGQTKLGLNLKNWKFSIDVPSHAQAAVGNSAPRPYDKSGPILVVKLAPGKLSELADEATRAHWTQPELFNNDAVAVQKELQTRLKVVQALATGGGELAPLFQPIFDRFNDENWNGAVVFGLESLLEELPDQVAVLAAGIKGKLSINAVGVDLNRVAHDLQAVQSSAFAAFKYGRTDVATAGTDGFRFTVKLLAAGFDNSDLRGFVCRAELDLARFLGADATEGSRVIQIEGHYERRTVTSGRDRYVFSATRRFDIDFGSNPVFKRLALNRLQLSSEADSDFVTGRFALWGQIDFADGLAKLAYIKSLAFEDSAILLKIRRRPRTPEEEKPDFSAEAGRIKVDWQPGPSPGIPDILSRLPMRLTGFQWSGRSHSGHNIPELRLPDLGMVNLNFGDLPAFRFGDSFDFGLEFDLNFGSMGKLLSGTRSLGGRLILGWPDFTRLAHGETPRIALGFKFEGGAGALDIGVQGILRITARNAAVKRITGSAQSGTAILLQEARLQVLGYTVPEKAEQDIFVFVPDKTPRQPSWWWMLKNADVGPVKIDLLALAQRVRLGGNAKSVAEIVTETRKLSDVTDPSNLQGDDVIDPAGGWSTVLSAKVADVVSVQFALMDAQGVYGIALKVPAEHSMIDVDVLYRRLADDLGMFAAQITPRWRSFEFGAASVTLGTIGFESYTNGNWKVSFGFPFNDDYSASFSLQMIPFIGFGGFYVGRLNWRTSASTDPDLKCDPVIELGFAGRFGVGKEIRQGPFSAGASLTVYSVLTGAIGIPTVPNPPIGRYIRIYGRAGIMLEVFGVVDFGIVRAAVVIRAWIEESLLLETWHPIMIAAEAGVSVSVVIVIARFRIFGHTIEIKVSFSFGMRLRLEFPLGYFDGEKPRNFPPGANALGMVQALELEARPEPISWTAFRVVNGVLPSIPLVLSCDATSGDDRAPRLVPILAAVEPDNSTTTVLTPLLRALMTWTVWCHVDAQPAPGENPEARNVTAKDLRDLSQRLSAPREGGTLARGGPKPLNIDRIRQFLALNVSFAVGPAPDAQTPGTPLPWLPGLNLDLAKPDGQVEHIDFNQAANRWVDYAWEQAFRERLQEMAPEVQRETEDPPEDKTSKTPLELLFEDWIALLVRTLGAECDHWARKQPGPANAWTIGSVLDGLGGKLRETALLGARMLYHGLRTPGADGKGDLPLFALLGLSLEQARLPQNSRIQAARAVDAAWINLGADARVELTAGWADLLSHAIAALPAPQLAAKRPPWKFDAMEIRISQKDRLANPLSGALQPVLWALPVELTEFDHTSQPLEFDGAITPQATWATRVEFVLRRIRRSDDRTKFIRGVYQVGGADEANRRKLDAFHDDATLGKLLRQPTTSAALLYGSPNGTAVLAGSESFLFKTDLSTEPRPPDVEIETMEQAAPNPMSAALTDPAGVAEILRQASIVNGGGFFLRAVNQGATPLEALFDAAKEGTAIQVSIVIVFGRAPGEVLPDWNPVYNAVLTADSGDEPLHAKLPRRPQLQSPTTPGHIAVLVERNNPIAGVGFSDPTPDPERALAAQYGFVDYGIIGTSDFVERKSGWMLPAGPTDDDGIAGSPQPHVLAAEPVTLSHHILLPTMLFARENWISDHDQPVRLKQVAKRSPYAGIGKRLNVQFGLRDAYGNRWPGGQLPQQDFTPLYTDPLPPISAWPGLRLSWSATQTHTLGIKIDYGQGEGPAPHVDKFYPTLLHVLEATGVRASAIARINDRPVGTSADILDQLLRIVRAIVDKPANPNGAEINLPLETVSPTVPAALRVVLRLERAADLVEPKLRDHDPRIQAVESEVPPSIAAADGKVSTAAWTKFAEAFEQRFAELFFLRRIDARGGGSAWVLRRDVVRDLTLGGSRHLIAAAPTPLATALRSGTASVHDFRSTAGQQFVKVSVSDIDLDATAARVFAALERCLEPALAVQFRLANPDQFNRLVSAKGKIAEAFAARLHPTLARDTFPTPAAAQEARRSFANRLRADLRTSYSIGAIAQVECRPGPATVAQGPPPKLYGEPTIGAARPEIRFWPSRVTRGESNAAPTLTFIVEWTDPRDNPSAQAKGPLTFAPEFIEWPEAAVDAESETSYIPSRWFQLLTDPARKPISLSDEVRVPLPLRRVPPTPIVRRHGYAQGEPIPDSPTPSNFAEHIVMARRWAYFIDTEVPTAGQDSVFVTAEYPSDLGQPSVQETVDRGVFDALVSFSHHWPDIESVLNALGPPEPGSQASSGLADVVLHLAVLADDLAEGLKDDLQVQARVEAEATADRAVAQTPDPKSLKMHILSSTRSAPRVGALRLDSATGDAPWVPLSPKLGGETTDTSYATNEGGEGPVRGRRFWFLGLDAMHQQAAQGRVQVERNREIDGLEIAAPFLYRTAEVMTADPVRPHLHYDVRLDASLGRLASPAAHLHDFFAALGADAPQMATIDLHPMLAVPFGPAAAELSPQDVAAWHQYPLPALRDMPLEASAAEVLGAAIAMHLAQSPISKPVGAPDPEIRMAATVFVPFGQDKRPLLTLSALYLPVSRITPSAGPMALSAQEMSEPAVLDDRQLANLVWRASGILRALPGCPEELGRGRRAIALALRRKLLPVHRAQEPAPGTAAWRECYDAATRARRPSLEDPSRFVIWPSEDGIQPDPGYFEDWPYRQAPRAIYGPLFNPQPTPRLPASDRVYVFLYD